MNVCTQIKMEIREIYPSIPKDNLQDIIDWNSGRIFLANTLPYNIHHAETLCKWVKNHIRHEMTDYDDLLYDGYEQFEARRAIKSERIQIESNWKLK